MSGGARPQAVRIPAGPVELDADLVPAAPGRGTVVFAHGSGSGRKSPRNREVAERLHAHGFGTLLVDLLARAEVPVDELTREYRFNVPLLSERLLAATDWMVARSRGTDARLGFFGASTGGAVAMIAAAQRDRVVRAIVLRGARSDLGDRFAAQVRCPTLILVGDRDPEIRVLNEQTLRLMGCDKGLVVIPGASHLFEEPGALERVAEHTVAWFDRHLSSAETQSGGHRPGLAPGRESDPVSGQP